MSIPLTPWRTRDLLNNKIQAMTTEKEALGLAEFCDRQIGDSECGVYWQRQFRRIAAALRALTKGEFICSRCGHRKDGEGPDVDF